MEHFPQEILHSILRRTSVYSQNESTMVCRAWRVAARHVLSQTASKIIMRSNRLAHYALQLDSIPNFGQGISTVALSVRAAQGLDSANQFEDIVRRWPLLVNLLFHGTHPGLFVERLLDANIALPYLEQIRVSREHIASLGHFYLELLRRYSSSLRRITIDVSASGLFDTLLVLYGNVARYVAGFPNLKHLVLLTDRQVVLNTLLSSCPGLKTLELSVDPGRFLAVQDVAVPPVSHLEQLKVDAGVISLRLYAYLREFCPYLKDLHVSCNGRESLAGMVDTFDYYLGDLTLAIKSFAVGNGLQVSLEMLGKLATWFPLLNTVDFGLADFSLVTDDQRNIRLAFGRLRVAFMSIDLSPIIGRELTMDKVAFEFVVGGQTVWLQRDGAWRTGKQFTMRHNARYLTSSQHRYHSMDTAVVRVEAASIATIRFVTSYHNSLFKQTIHLNL
ncbi:hypothetical protein HMPREF1544_00535 [Mucor circinelloides 1006PhL]|uniref:F-box domain-containing protein n=1 Tax=Mucor circinelloides f. circinelloides (strain 1006PhL) TaxID=1220926 RepID=S2JVQ6_MUCC1|nr:hypothetical protein HMPREF1544_00535 [Mucor circinelloides 1006PhL]